MDYKSEALSYLENYRKLNHAVGNLQRQIERIEQNEGPTLNALHSMKLSDLPKSNPQQEEAFNMLYKLQVLTQSLHDTLRDIQDIDEALEILAEENELYKIVLVETVIKKREITELSREIDYSTRQISRIKHEALTMFAVLFLGIIALE